MTCFVQFSTHPFVLLYPIRDKWKVCDLLACLLWLAIPSGYKGLSYEANKPWPINFTDEDNAEQKWIDINAKFDFQEDKRRDSKDDVTHGKNDETQEKPLTETVEPLEEITDEEMLFLSACFDQVEDLPVGFEAIEGRFKGNGNVYEVANSLREKLNKLK